MSATMVEHTIGIDPDRDWVTASVVDTATTGKLASEAFETPVWDMFECWNGQTNTQPLRRDAMGRSRAPEATAQAAAGYLAAERT